MGFFWKMNYLRAWRCDLGEVHVSIGSTLSARWSGSIVLRTPWKGGMLFGYKNIRFHAEMT
jgi:hypothetical protein